MTSQVHLYHSIVKIYDSEGHSKLTILQAKQIVKTYGTKQTIQEVLRGIDCFQTTLGGTGTEEERCEMGWALDERRQM